MESDIQFGPLQVAEPAVAVRPDQDCRYLTVECGKVGPNDTPVFVDLDVMRDMESHARTNMDVELGGVMLGGQYVDDQGVPFILVTDSLRARHYEATKGSFKFTQETWSQITRDRSQLASDISMVGWYHTHPGWGVFLSGMDLFICDNFFNRPLDVALVIDPCSGQRGWFQWNNEQTEKQPSGGFFLIGNRYRASDLERWSRYYNKRELAVLADEFPSQQDSRDDLFPRENPMVKTMSTRRLFSEFAIFCLLTVQLGVLAWMGWHVLDGKRQIAETSGQESSLSSIANREALRENDVLRARERVYGEILEQVTASHTGQAGIVEEMVGLKTQQRRLIANLEGQLARVQEISRQNEVLNEELESARQQATSLQQQMVGLEQVNQAFEQKVVQLQGSQKTVVEELPNVRGVVGNGWLQRVRSLSKFWGYGLVFLLGGGIGFWWNRHINRLSNPKVLDSQRLAEFNDCQEGMSGDRDISREAGSSLARLR